MLFGAFSYPFLQTVDFSTDGSRASIYEAERDKKPTGVDGARTRNPRRDRAVL